MLSSAWSVSGTWWHVTRHVGTRVLTPNWTPVVCGAPAPVLMTTTSFRQLSATAASGRWKIFQYLILGKYCQDTWLRKYFVRLLRFLPPGHRVMIGSDGSVEISMAFGWKMGNNMEEILVECFGPTYGTALSFHAESYGALFIVRFIHRLYCYKAME